MAGWAGLGTGGRSVVIGFGAVVLAGASYLMWPATPVPDAVASAPVAVEDAPAVGAVPEAEVAPEPETEVAPEPAVTVDIWRVAPDGAGLVVGQAPAGGTVRIAVDGVVVAETVATGAGEFVAQLTLAPNPEPSLMTVRAVLADGRELVADAVIALGPIAGPVIVVAEAEPVVAPAPEADVEAIPKENPVAALMVTDKGAVVLQDAAVGDGAEVSVDTISYTATGAVQLGGRGGAGALLQLYLDNALIRSLTVPDDGQWLTTLGDTAPGIYTLRVDQLDGAGKVTSRFETPFQRETLEALAAVAATEEKALAKPVVEGAAGTETAVAEAEPVPEAEPVVEAEPVAAAGIEPIAGASTHAETALEPEIAAATAVDAESEPVADATVGPETTPEPAAMPKVEPVAIADAAPEVEAAPKAEGVALSEPVSEPIAVIEPAAAASVTVTVQPGFTLWGIAKGQMGEGVMYVQVFEANRDKIRDPDLIYPGQVFVLPAMQ